ncbi:MAG: rhomboid family intramembrane serine protease [Ignavibacteriaceae bacterium]|nr:rhomboid family intramembrane serine protease [Ignavibacteriaceae bacterium]
MYQNFPEARLRLFTGFMLRIFLKFFRKGSSLNLQVIWDRIHYEITIPTLFIMILWVIKLIEWITGFSLSWLGIIPRDTDHLIGILMSPLIHGDFGHLMSNTPPLFVLGFLVLFFYPAASRKAIPLMYVMSGMLLWTIGRPAIHIGASTIVYALAAFLFGSGVVRRDIRSIGLALLVVFLYGGSLSMGLIPADTGVSWEGHLSGGIAGVVMALIFRKEDPPKKYSWEEEDDEDGVKKYYKENYFN